MISNTTQKIEDKMKKLYEIPLNEEMVQESDIVSPNASAKAGQAADAEATYEALEAKRDKTDLAVYEGDKTKPTLPPDAIPATWYGEQTAVTGPVSGGSSYVYELRTKDAGILLAGWDADGKFINGDPSVDYGGKKSVDGVWPNLIFEGTVPTGDRLATSDEALLAIYYPEGNVTSVDQITTEGLEYAYDDATMTATLSNGMNATGDIVIPWKVTKDGKEYKVTAVENHAFYDYNLGGNMGITSVIAPTTVTSISYSAFSNCRKLTGVSFPSVTSIDNNAFDGCSVLASVSLPSVTSIGAYAFYGCTSLASVSFPYATSIGRGVFGGCSVLASVSLPSVTSIGMDAFASCSALASVDFGAAPRDAVPTFGIGAFSKVPTSCKIIVPLGMYDAWTAADGWKHLYAQGYKFMGYADAADAVNAADVAKKRDKTDNIVAADGVVFSEWKFTSDDPVVNAALAPGGWRMDEDFDGLQKYWLFSGPSIDGYEQSMVSLYPISELSVSGQIYTRLADGEMIIVTATREKTVIAKEGESYVSPTGVANLTADKMPKYGFADVAVAEGVLTIAPFTNAQLTSDGTAFTVAVGDGVGKVRDCVFVVTANATAPTISWGVVDGAQKFNPRTDRATDMEIAANTTKVFWVTEYTPDCFVVAGWEVPSVSE